MDLTPEQFRQVATIFAKACKMPEEERNFFLQEACSEDVELRTHIQRLLDDDARPAFSLESPPLARVVRAEGAALLQDSDGQPARPQRIGNYRILKVLGEGGFGVVFLAEQENPKRNVALKVVKPHMGSGALLRRFEHEARLLGRLEHPGIAHIYEAGTVEYESYGGKRLRRPFFAMELVRGKRITDYADDLKLGTRQRLALLRKVCDATHHAHLRGVIHRDLKPDNILVDNSAQPKILDFGVARATDSDIQMTTLRTDVGQLIGTISYMSPEQARGDSTELDIRSDVYTIGVIGYELLVGRLPHDLSRKTVPEAVRIIQEDQPTPLSSANRVFRGDLDTMFAKALEKDKTRRYQSAAEFALDLERYLDNQPLLARPPSTVYQLTKFAKRNKALVGGVVATFVALALGVVATTSQAVRATRASQEATAERLVAQEERNRAVSAQAQAQQRRAQAEAEAAKADAVNKFLQDMLASGDPRNAKNPELTVRDVLDEASQQIDDGSLSEQPDIEATVRATLGHTYAALGLYPVAEKNLRAAIEINRSVHGGAHLSVAENLTALGGVLLQAGDHATSKEVLEEALTVFRKLTPDDRLKEAPTLNNLAVLLEVTGDYDRAAALCRQVLDLRRKLLGDDHPHVGISLNNLAVLLRKKGDYGAAEEAYREALALNRERFGNEHVEVAGNLANLGLLLAYKRNYDEAQRLLSEALGIQRRLLGREHPHVATTLNSLAGVLHQRGDYDRAELMFLEALGQRRKFLGDEHPRVALIARNLAVLLRDKGDAARALPFALESLRIYRHTPGSSSPRLADSLSLVGQVLLDQGRAAQAEPMLRECLEIRRHALSDGDVRIARAQSLLGACLTTLGRFEEAEELLVGCYEGLCESHGAHDKETIRAVKNLVRLYQASGSTERAGKFRVILESADLHLPAAAAVAETGE